MTKQCHIKKISETRSAIPTLQNTYHSGIFGICGEEEGGGGGGGGEETQLKL